MADTSFPTCFTYKYCAIAACLTSVQVLQNLELRCFLLFWIVVSVVDCAISNVDIVSLFYAWDGPSSISIELKSVDVSRSVNCKKCFFDRRKKLRILQPWWWVCCWLAVTADFRELFVFLVRLNRTRVVVYPSSKNSNSWTRKTTHFGQSFYIVGAYSWRGVKITALCSNLPCRRSGNDNPDPRCSAGDVSSVSTGNLSDHDGMRCDAKYQVFIS